MLKNISRGSPQRHSAAHSGRVFSLDHTYMGLFGELIYTFWHFFFTQTDWTGKTDLFPPGGTVSRKVPPHHGMTGSDQFIPSLPLRQRWEMSDGIFTFTFLTSVQLYSHPTPMASPFLVSMFLSAFSCTVAFSLALRVTKGAGAYPSCLRAEAQLHPG